MMNLEIKSNPYKIFRQPESRLNLGRVDKGANPLTHNYFSLRSHATSFVVDNKFSFQLDEII